MSALTKAMAPREHEWSRLVGLAAWVVHVKPAVSVPLRALWLSDLIQLDIMLLDFDAECEEASDAIERQLADWRAEIDWANYKVRHLIGAAA